MRILLISHNTVRGDGQGRVNLELARDLVAHGHQLTLLADRVDPGLVQQGAQWVPIHPLLDRPNLVKTPLFALTANRWVRRRRQDFDLIVANGYVLTESHHVNISQFVHGAWRATGHESSSSSTVRSLYQKVYSGFNSHQEKRAYGTASVVVASSHAVGRELIGIGVPEDRVRVIHNGVDTDEFHPGPEDPVRLGLPSQGPRALFVGDICSNRKNLDTVLQALRSVQEVRLVVVGGLRGSPYPAMAQQLGVADRVTFVGYRSDVPSIMRACDFLVFPTRYEPFGLVVLEALSSGLPVIVSRAAGAAEIMSSQCGFILEDPNDVPSLSSAMRQLADEQVRGCMAKAARDTASAHGWRRMAGEYLTLFHSLNAHR